jgi:hypothetical protein
VDKKLNNEWQRFQDLKDICSCVGKVSGDFGYLADTIYLRAFLSERTNAHRHMLGGIGWPIWIFLRLGAPRFYENTNFEDVDNSKHWLLNSISTPAHVESLEPIFRELSPDALWANPFECWCKITKENLLFAKIFFFLKYFFESSKSLLMLLICSLRHPYIFKRILSRFSEVLELIYEYKFARYSGKTLTSSLFGFVTTYEVDPITKAIVARMRDKKLRVIHIMHGQRLPTYQITRATDLVLFSKIDETWFRDRIDGDIRIWTVGHPRLEKIRKVTPAPREYKLGDTPRITFFSQPYEGAYSREQRMQDWVILKNLTGKADVRFRLHPRESKRDAETDLLKVGLDFIHLSDNDLFEDLAWCDAVASSWSTVSMEAAACGRGIFWTCSTPEKYEASQELRDHGIGTLIQDPGDWEDHLAAWDRGGWGAPVIVPTERLKELGMIGDMDTPWLERLGLANSLK